MSHWITVIVCLLVFAASWFVIVGSADLLLRRRRGIIMPRLVYVPFYVIVAPLAVLAICYVFLFHGGPLTLLSRAQRESRFGFVIWVVYSVALAGVVFYLLGIESWEPYVISIGATVLSFPRWPGRSPHSLVHVEMKEPSQQA